MTLSELKPILESLSYLATIIGIPVAILVFLYGKQKDKISHEIDSYLRANDKYIQYLILCLEYPDLGFYDNSLKEPEVANSGLDIRQLTLFTILVSTLETGFFLFRYLKSSSILYNFQWYGWHEYLKYWATRSDFRKGWIAIGSQFDKEFQLVMNNLINETESIIEP
jgi:hypothetical protein